MGMPRTATKPQSAKIQNVVVNDRINYALTIQNKYRKRLKTCSTDQSRVTPRYYFDFNLRTGADLADLRHLYGHFRKK